MQRFFKNGGIKFAENCRNFCTKGKQMKDGSSKSRIDKIHENFNDHYFGHLKREGQWLKEIPFEYNPSYIFGCCGALCGLTLLLINPTNNNQDRIPLPYPNIFTSNYNTISMVLLGSTMAGIFGGKMYIIRINNKNLQRTFSNLINKTYLSIAHCAGFGMVSFYGLIGMSLICETLYNGEPFGWTLIEEEFNQAQSKSLKSYEKIDLYSTMDYYNPRLRARGKFFSECDSDEIKNRFGFAMELLAHTMVESYLPIFGIFLIGSGILIKTHTPYWNQLYKRLKIPQNLSQTLNNSPNSANAKPNNATPATSINQIKYSFSQYVKRMRG